MRISVRNGFTAIELALLVVVGVSTSAVVGPAMSKMRSQMQGVTSEGNLHMIGQGAGMFGQDNDGKIFTFSWRGGNEYLNIRNGNTLSPVSDAEASSYEAREILWNATGRINGVGRIFAPQARLMHRRYSHLVLADYMGGNVADPMWADPADAQLLHWQETPLEYREEFNTIPYGMGYPKSDFYDQSQGWDDVGVRQFWSFGSSYQQVASAWLFDDRATYIPNYQSPHLYSQFSGPQGAVAQRYFNEVTFPSAKVFMHEEFDREQKGTPYFMYDFAAPAKLMFDGSINTALTGEATLGVNPAEELHQKDNGELNAYYQNYIALDQFPLALNDKITLRYRWSSGGLKGLDYPRNLMGSR